jgi:hypothetical protein
MRQGKILLAIGIVITGAGNFSFWQDNPSLFCSKGTLEFKNRAEQLPIR